MEQEKLKQFKIEIKNSLEFSNKLNNIFQYEFDNLLSEILCLPEKNFFEKLKTEINKILTNLFSKEIFNDFEFNKLFNEKETFFNNKYKQIFEKLSSTWMNYQNSLENNLNTDDYYLKHFQKHCLDTGEFAYHSCSKKRSKFLICKNNQNEIFFVICSLCKKVYKSNFIQNYCFPCNKNYYSKFIENDNFLFPATWEKYHCQLLINEKMKCIKCKEILYLNIKTNTLICLNKQCNFQSNPQRILWTCALCKEEFKSRAILYNNLEMEKLKNIIKFSLILKNKAKPKNLPCKCVNNNNEFVHKKDCDGKLFFGEFDNINNNNNNNNNKSLLVICNKCQAVNYYERFIWTCPVCGIRFRDKKYHKNYNYNSNGNLLFKPYVNEKFFTEKKFNNEDNNDNNNFCDGFNCRSTTNIFVDCNNNNNNNNDNNNVYNSNKKKVFGKGRKIFESGNLNKRKNLNLNSNLKINNNNNNNEEKDDFNKSIVKNLFNNDENNKKHSNRNKNNNKEMIKSETKIDLFNYKLNKENKNNKNRLLNKSESKKDFFKINNNNNNNHFEKKNLSITPISTERGIYKKKNENKREIKKNLNDDFNFTTNNVFINNNNNENNDDLNKTIIDRTNLLLNKNNNNNKNKRLRKISSEKNFFNTENNNISKIIEKKIHKINNNNKRIHQLSTVFEEEIKQNNNNENNNENKENNNENNKKIIKYDSNNNINKKEKEKKYNEEIKKNKFLDYDSIMKKLSEKKDDDKKGVVTLYREHKQREIERKERIHKEKIEKLKSKNNNKITLINECSKNDDSNENILKENIKNLEKIIFNNNNNNNNNKNIKNINNNNNNDNLSVSCNSTSLESNNNNNNKISKSKNSNYSDLLIKDKISLNKINNNNNTNNNNNNIENELILKQDSNNKINNSNIKINNNSNINSLNDSNNNNNNNLNNNFIITNQNISDRISNILNNSKISPFSLNDYTLESTLGEGTYGTIFLSTHKATKNKFAIKKIIAKDIFELEDFQKEFEILNSCQHEYILKVKSYTIQILDETTFALYVLMELALFDWESEIKKKSSIKKFYTENELITILKKLLNALFFLQNNKKIAHRDLKPQNILIFPNNIFKLSDFGEAKIISNNINTNNNKKQMNTLRGTELYMAPILYKGCKLDLDDVSHEPFKSDVYSLGVCFVYAATLNFKVLYEVRDCEKNEEIKYVLEKYLKFKYSDEFISCVCKMLEVDECKRMDFIMLKEFVEEKFGSIYDENVFK